MEIRCEQLSKRFGFSWIFRDFTFTFLEDSCYAITGPNGSGKSTLLKVLSGSLPATSGKVLYREEKNIEIDDIYRNLSIATPYLELIEELTLKELLQFHFSIRNAENNLSIEDCIDILGMSKEKNKLIREFSSGMKQRVKLALAFFTSSKALFLDEPTVNLDRNGVSWYKKLLEEHRYSRTTLIFSNQEEEYETASSILYLGENKTISVERR